MATWTARDIMDAIDEGKFRIAERQAEYEARRSAVLDEQNAKIDAAWQPVIANIKESTPEWAWQYLTHPRQMPEYYSEHCNFIRPATIDLQGMGMVFVYADGQNAPMFRPARWYLACSRTDDDETWSVEVDNGSAETMYSLPGNPDFLIALAQAYENMAGYAELNAEADRRNAERQKMTVEQPKAIDWLLSAEVYMDDDGGEVKAIACALIGILEQLKSTR